MDLNKLYTRIKRKPQPKIILDDPTEVSNDYINNSIQSIDT